MLGFASGLCQVWKISRQLVRTEPQLLAVPWERVLLKINTCFNNNLFWAAPERTLRKADLMRTGAASSVDSLKERRNANSILSSPCFITIHSHSLQVAAVQSKPNPSVHGI